MTHESAEVPTEDRFGVGPFPSELNVMNWGAALAAPLWILAHGVWLWLVAVLVYRFASVYIRMGLQEVLGGALVAQAVSIAVVSVAWWVLTLYFGTRANRAAWDAEARRSDRPQPRALVSSVAEFETRQRAWIRYGLLIVAFGYAWVIYGAWQRSPEVAAATAIGYSAGLLTLGIAWVAFRLGAFGRSS